MKSFYGTLLLAVGLTEGAFAQSTDVLIQDLQALDEAMQILLGTPESQDVGRTMADADMAISMTARGGVWSIDGMPLEDGRLVLPVEQMIVLSVMANDLVYDMSFPDLELEFEAIPGRLEVVWVEFHQVGQYAGNCEQLCGSAGAPLIFDVRDMAATE